MKGIDIIKIPPKKKVFISKSRIHGFGLFSKVDVKKGDKLFIIKGDIRRFNVKDKKTAQYAPNWIGIGKNTWIDPKQHAIYLNHSSKPTCGIKGMVTVCAMRDFKKNKEVTIDYSTTEEQLLWSMENKENPRKPEVIRSIQFMPKKKFLSYLPYIPRYFQKVYLKYNKKNEK